MKKHYLENFVSTGMKHFITSNTRDKKIILMTGAPGVGKGTFSKMLSKDFNIPEFSTGDELRKIINSSTNDLDILKIKQIIQEGKLINDEYMLKLVQKRLENGDTKNGIIFDGYPRNLNQAGQFKQITAVVDIYLNEEILVQKILGRRVCSKCGNNYNIYQIKENGYDMDPLLPKKNPKKCDECNGDLMQREDDKESIIRDRLEVYKKYTLPLLDYYQKQNILIRFEPKKGKKDYPILKEIIIDFLKNHNQ